MVSRRRIVGGMEVEGTRTDMLRRLMTTLSSAKLTTRSVVATGLSAIDAMSATLVGRRAMAEPSAQVVVESNRDAAGA